MLARGIRNNNPGNIELNSNKWLGLSQEQTDGRFAQFTTMPYGCRALLKLLSNYYRIYGLNTVKSIINRWAPNNENNTDAYVKSVCKYLNVAPNQKIDLSNIEILVSLGKAIALHENGKDANIIAESDWEKAVSLL